VRAAIAALSMAASTRVARSYVDDIARTAPENASPTDLHALVDYVKDTPTIAPDNRGFGWSVGDVPSVPCCDLALPAGQGSAE
jgi:hypothetical protein